MDKNEALANECKRIANNTCLYTSTSLFIWLKCLRVLRIFFLVTPAVLGSVASWKLLTGLHSETAQLLVASMAFVAGLLPATYSILKLDDHLVTCAHLAGEFKNLQDRFDLE